MIRFFDASRSGHPVPTEVLAELSARAKACSCEFLVIGAAARDLVVHAVTGDQPQRATRDVDIAVAVSGYDAFREYVSVYSPTGKAVHTFTVLGVKVDIVPFGGVEEGRQVTFSDGQRLDTNGLKEAAVAPVSVRLSESLVVPVASLPAQTVLKILAWRDRRHDDRKDAVDLRSILDAAATSPYVDALWDEVDLLERFDFNVEAVASYVVGGQAAALYRGSPDAQAVLDILEDRLLREELLRDMGSLLGQEQIEAYVAGYREGR